MRRLLAATCSFAILIAAALLAMMPAQLAADEISVSGTEYFTEADTVYLAFDVDSNGNITPDPNGLNQAAAGYWTINWDGGCGPEYHDCAVDFPELPAGSVITSGTFSYDIGSGINVNGQNAFTGGGTTTPPYSASLFTSAGCSGAGGSQASSGSFSFTPCSDAEQTYFLSFSGNDNLMAQPSNVFGEGTYGAAVNLYVSADYTITVDYSQVPEPRTYGLVAGLMVAMAFVRRSRLRTRSAIPVAVTAAG